MAPEERRIWVDGRLVPWAEATVHVLSHAVQRGTLVFDFMSVHETPSGVAVFRLRDHLQRFARSCELVGLRLDRGIDELAAATCHTVRENPGSHSVKISAYLPSVEVEIVPQDDRVAVAIAAYDIVADIIEVHPGTYRRRRELRLWIEKEKRNRRDDILAPQAKVAGNYAATLLAKSRARSNGYDDILLLSEDGSLAEAPTANLLLVDQAGTLRTPPGAQVLHGVTRSSVLELAATEGIECAEHSLYPEDLLAAAEVFLTVTSIGIWPVVSVDGQPIGDGCVGTTTKRLRERLRQVQSGQDPRFHHWLDPVEDG